MCLRSSKHNIRLSLKVKIIQSVMKRGRKSKRSQHSAIKLFDDLSSSLWDEEKKRGSAPLRFVLMGHDVRGARGEGRTRILSMHNRLLSSPVGGGGDNRDARNGSGLPASARLPANFDFHRSIKNLHLFRSNNGAGRSNIIFINSGPTCSIVLSRVIIVWPRLVPRKDTLRDPATYKRRIRDFNRWRYLA